MQLLELTTHGTQCKIHPCSAAILLQDLPSPKSALLVFTQQTQHQVEPCALGLVPSSLQHQPGGLVPHCPQCHSCPQCHPQPSSTMPTRNPQCSGGAAWLLLPVPGQGHASSAVVTNLFRIPGVLESLKKKMQKKMTVS